MGAAGVLYARALANFFSQTPVLRDVAKWVGGIDPRRSMPPFAAQTFKDWFAAGRCATRASRR